MGEMVDAKQKTINKFTSIPGIGYARARVLYEHGFRNIKDLKEASLSELSQVPSISMDVAEGIQEYLLDTTFEGDIALEGPGLEKELAGLEEDVLDSVIEDFIDNLERDLKETGEKEIPAHKIGEKIMEKLHELDAVAYVRFASVYREFKDVNDFVSELKSLLSNEKSS